jgi:hypothetical protein
MRVPSIRYAGRLDRLSADQPNTSRCPLDPLNLMVWGLFAALIPVNWTTIVWGLTTLI